MSKLIGDINSDLIVLYIRSIGGMVSSWNYESKERKAPDNKPRITIDLHQESKNVLFELKTKLIDLCVEHDLDCFSKIERNYGFVLTGNDVDSAFFTRLLSELVHRQLSFLIENEMKKENQLSKS